MKFLGKNSIFALKVKIRVSESFIIGTAAGTALTLKALPLPSPVDIRLNKYFKKRVAKNQYDSFLEEVYRESCKNIELNFQMPVLTVLGLNQRPCEELKTSMNNSVQFRVDDEVARRV